MYVCRRILTALIVAGVLSGQVCGDEKLPADTKFSTPAPQTQRDASSQHNNGKPQLPDCSQPNADPRCKPAPPHYDPHPSHYHYPSPYRPRPVIVNQLPSEPAIEINSLTDDWEGCRKAKLGAMRARDSGHTEEANNLDEWLWKNCRSYSNELRQLEQDDM